MSSEITPGTRVSVGSGDGTQDLGLGIYEGEAEMHTAFMMEGNSLFLLSSMDEKDLDKQVETTLKNKKRKCVLIRKAKTTTPKIKLDSGRVIYGSQCWWGPAGS